MNNRKNEMLDTEITTYWWNHGQKKKDFVGTYRDWFTKYKISVIYKERYAYFSGEYGGFKFKMRTAHYDSFHAFDLVIKACLTYMGDKALLLNGYRQEHKVNWR